jgi:signal transduction histidine kinase/tetratricopeptide (TPR) repeat protein
MQSALLSMSRLGNRSLRILLFFLILTGLPLAALTWLGWQLLQQDRDLELQRQREQLQNASELLVRDLQVQLQTAERSLREPERASRETLGNGAFFRLQAGRVVERSGAALPFYPVAKRPVDSHASLFAAAERLEFLDGRCDLALRPYREFATAAQGDVRAGGLMRLARCLRKLRRHDEALEIYQQLRTLGDTPIAGMPAELLARRERIELLASGGNADAARVEAHVLRELLLKGHFTVDRGTFEFFVEKLGIAEESIVHLPLALAAETWSSRWQGDVCGRLAGSFAGSWMLGLWCRNAGDDIHVMLVPANDVLERLRPSAQSMQVAAAVNDEVGNIIWGAVPAQAVSVARHLSDLGFPWQLRVSSAEPAQVATLISRRRALAASGLALMVVIVAAAAFFVFRAVNRELEIARLQADFISTVSHEFRTPLTAMNHLTEMLEETAVPAERVPQYYAALHRETKRLQRVVESLLDFRRFEAGRRAYRMERMDALETVRQVLESYATRDDSRRLQVSLSAASATIRGDREAVAVAVSNLLDNALKYSPADAPVSIEVEPHGTMVGISVQDRGSGITRDERRRVFRKFVRGAAAHEGNVKGTGIGLAIVEAVVKAHGGRIDLHTVPGQGSRFTLLLPRA